MFLFPPKRPKRAPLESQFSQLPHDDGGTQFTSEEVAGITALRNQFVKCPESLKLDLDYRRLLFARWLIQHGHLGESLGAPQRTQPAFKHPPLNDHYMTTQGTCDVCQDPLVLAIPPLLDGLANDIARHDGSRTQT